LAAFEVITEVLGLLAGAVGGLGIGLIQFHQMSVSSSSSSSPTK
jgi:hypothetical protein